MKKYNEMSLGIKKAETVIKGGSIVNVFTKEIYKADVALAGGMIIGVGNYQGEKEIDATGKVICPGFIDSHLHLESTLVSPVQLIEEASKWGTTTFVVDPHEAANVAGLEGINYMLDATKDAAANVYVMMPSCVPAIETEDNGAVILAKDMLSYKDNERILGLGEVMDIQSVLDGKDEMLEKIEVFKDKTIDGHAGFLSEKEIMCYRLAGIETDHECIDFETARMEARAGISVLIREGTAAKNLDAIVKGILKEGISTSDFAFCTDDKHIDDINKEGHISYNIKRAIELGMKPVDAITMATYHGAKIYGLKHLGAIAPGYQADLVILSDLERVEIEAVFHKGEPISRENHGKIEEPSKQLLNTVHIEKFRKKDLKLKLTKTKAPIINLIENQIQTALSLEEVPRNGDVFTENAIYNKVAVVERHHNTGKIGVGICKGYGIKGGAVATTFSHDSHNLVMIGDNDNDMYLAAKELEKSGGGYVIVSGGKVVHRLDLPIMGLMSNRNHEEVSKNLSLMIDALRNMGVPKGVDPFITLSFLALPVIPEVRITTRGVYQVGRSKQLEF
ncbi:adenine deaminase [Aequitasia blattaphilus]|uniref:Adenine deaminase n=1 Tax=Aequitasia blattaphilus TaxID=2949332 RepID=A0ABT1EBT2_9FIRM|nr:adenine deaminase [Aequitasia blattaphilus]MCP1103298.1 adenine deaminase [Aequitasia blattaphilus]MCR8615938.1 adenine deaminase [Aequitasia blattaphilus]